MSQPLRYPRPRSLGQLGPGHKVVESSAGTGKTFLLEHLFIDLILTHHVAADQILVVTFTEKATAELVLRLRRLVGELANLRADHAEAIKAAGLPAAETWVIDESAKGLLDKALLTFDRNSIFTIHGFCQRVLRENAFVQGRLFDEELVGENTVFGEAFAEVLRKQVATDAGLTTLLGAWLGKARTIASLRELLLACGRADVSALRPAFDQARLSAAMAAWQPVAADDSGLQPRLKAAGMHGGTIKATLKRLARVSDILDHCAGDCIRFLAEADAAPGLDLALVLRNLAGLPADPVLASLGQRVGELEACVVSLKAAIAQRLLPLVGERAARRKRMAGHFDFEDMLVLVDRALADPGPAGIALLASLRARYQHALIDEFQDTDEIQWSIFRRIFVDAGDRHALTAIGDPKQAIYGFRGANVFTYLEARDVLMRSGAASLTLDHNYRSTAELIEATNLIFDQSADFLRRASGITYDHPVTCGRPQRKLVGKRRLPAPAVVVFDLATKRRKLAADDARAAVASAIVAELGELLCPDSPLRLRDGESERRVKAGDVFILTFTNSDSQTIGRALAQAGIDFAFYKQDQLWKTPEAGEILDVLRAVCAPDDRALLARALLTRFFALDLPEVAASAELGGGAGPAHLLSRLAGLARNSDVPAFFSSLVEETGVLRREVFAARSERGLTNIMHVLELLQEHWSASHASLPELVDVLGAYVRGTQTPPGREGDLQRLETDRNAVQILTVYKAKGLEADVVFVYGGTGQKGDHDTHVFHEGSKRVIHVGTPGPAAALRIREEQEDERSRQLYVALTRARYRLYLPRYPTEYGRLDGPYTRMNGRLGGLLGEEAAAGRQHFEVRPVDCETGVASERDSAGAAALVASDASLLTVATVPAELAVIREQRRGFVVTSYTAVKRARAGVAPVEEAAQPVGPGEHHAAQERAADSLPGGAETGIFLHELLESVVLGDLATMPAFPDWFGNPAVQALFGRLGRRHARPTTELPAAGRMVYAAYTTPVHLHGTVIPGLAVATRALREMEFLYPIPESGHPLLSATTAGDLPVKWTIERGAVKGFIDLLFEHEGRIHLCDWKSDILPSYTAATMAGHCRQHYDVQTRLYTIAALRFAGITTPAAYQARFGAVIFCFLRGRSSSDPKEGIHCLTPTWDEVLAWEDEMLGRPFWGLAR